MCLTFRCCLNLKLNALSVTPSQAAHDRWQAGGLSLPPLLLRFRSGVHSESRHRTYTDSRFLGPRLAALRWDARTTKRNYHGK